MAAVTASVAAPNSASAASSISDVKCFCILTQSGGGGGAPSRRCSPAQSRWPAVGFPIARPQLSNATTQSEVLTEARPKSGATTRQGALKEAAPLTRTLQMPLCPRLLPALTCGYSLHADTTV